MRIVDRPRGPAGSTHAFVVGVGHYPHLPATIAEANLSSAAASAVAFAKWLESDYQNPDAPLATVDLVLTPGTVACPWANVERATIGNIRQAFKSFFADADLKPGNVAIFYFAGHGLSEVASFLLAEDFDPDGNQADPWFGAFSMDKTYLGMGRCNAALQLSFVEACRTRPADDFDTSGIDVTGLAAPAKNPVQRDAPIVYACESGQPAHGLPGEPGSFTKALLHVLGGAGAQLQKNSQWALTTADLKRISDVLQTWAEEDLVPEQFPDCSHFTRSTPLLRFSDVPFTEVLVRGATEPFVQTCDLVVQANPGPAQLKLPPQLAGRLWRCRLQKGTYDFSATDQGGSRSHAPQIPVLESCRVVELP